MAEARKKKGRPATAVEQRAVAKLAAYEAGFATVPAPAKRREGEAAEPEIFRAGVLPVANGYFVLQHKPDAARRRGARQVEARSLNK